MIGTGINHLIFSSGILLNSDISNLLGLYNLNNKMFAIGAVVFAALIAGIFSTTPMAVYAEDDYDDDEHDDDNGRDYDRDDDHDDDNGRDHDDDDYKGGDESETNTEQAMKQENVGSGESTNFNCGENSIDGGLIDVQACGTVGADDGDGGGGVTGAWCHNPANGPPQTLRNPGLGHIINAGNPGHEDDHPGACFPGET